MDEDYEGLSDKEIKLMVKNAEIELAKRKAIQVYKKVKNELDRHKKAEEYDEMYTPDEYR